MSITQTANVLITGTQLVKEILSTVLKAMDAAEAEKNSGADKKAWVIAATKHIILEGGRNWDKWEKYISDFIDAAKSIYNSLKGIF